jgi:hypothetical protein
MNKKSRKNDLEREYDFETMSGGIRGRYASTYRGGTNIAVLADDVASAFPTDDSVNRALRAILDAARAIPQRKPGGKAPKRPAAKRGNRGSSRQRRGGARG